MTKRRRRQTPSNPLESHKQKLETEMRQAGREFHIGPSTGEKMSEVLEEFIEPWRDLVDSRAAFDRLIGTAIIAWNAALLPKDERQKMLDAAAVAIKATSDKQTLKDFHVIMADFIRHKERHFAKNKRFIVSYQVQETKDGYHLSVASTP